MTGSPQKRSDLGPKDVARLEEQRAFVRSRLTDEALRERFQSAQGKLEALRSILEGGFGPENAWELQALGVVLGDAFVQELGYRWIIVEDEYGRDPALAVPGKSVVLYPLTMISKRVQKGRAVDVLELFSWTAAEVQQLE